LLKDDYYCTLSATCILKIEENNSVEIVGTLCFTVWNTDRKL